MSDEPVVLTEAEELERDRLILAKLKCEKTHLYFSRYFFKVREGIKFIVNWHHAWIADTVDKIISGEYENVIINVPPGSSKTELVVINLIARGLAINPRSRFLHLCGSDTLASQNSSKAREIVTSDAYQDLWPMRIADDAKAKKRWNVMVDGQLSGGVYATALGGQVTGFRAGHMAEGFQGAIIIDDPIKPEDAFSVPKLKAANRKLITTVKSRKANPKTPIILIMQRIAENDPTGYILAGNMPGKWTHIRIPAVLDELEVAKVPPQYRERMQREPTVDKRFSYWPYKEPLDQLLAMESGKGTDSEGGQISRFVFQGQYQQNPSAIGGNLIKGDDFVKYKLAAVPVMKWRKIFADTAQKTKERNDYSVFEEWGAGIDGRIYLLDLVRGKWEAPELQKRAIAFWAKCKARDVAHFGQLRKLVVEDKSSGTGLIQTLKLPPYNMPIEGIEREKDKLTRVNDGLPYIESGQVCIPEDAPFTSDFVGECEKFTADDTHDFDDQVDPMVDAIDDMLQAGNKLKQWEELAKKGSAANEQKETQGDRRIKEILNRARQ